MFNTPNNTFARFFARYCAAEDLSVLTYNEDDLEDLFTIPAGTSAMKHPSADVVIAWSDNPSSKMSELAGVTVTEEFFAGVEGEYELEGVAMEILHLSAEQLKKY